MRGTIIYFTGIYDTLDLFTAHLKDAFEELGYSSFVYDARDEAKSKEALLAMLKESAVASSPAPGGEAGSKGACEGPPRRGGDVGQDVWDGSSPRFACVTFNNMGYNLSLPAGASGIAPPSADANLWEAYQIPYINILMDHPFHYDGPLGKAPATSVVLCTDRNHVRYVRRFFPKIRRVDFLPHAGAELGHRHKPLRERGIDVLYAGALPFYTVTRMIPDFSSIPEVDGQAMAQEVLGELVRHPEKTTEEAIEDYLKAECGSLPERRVREIIVEMRFLDSYATSFFREQAVRVLVESGIRVTAYGTGWDQCEWSGNPYLTYGGKVSAPRILPLMNDAKVVLNTMTWFKAGAHDRIFNGMLAGAAVVTDGSSYLRREFTDGRELAMFSLEDIGTLPERVCGLFGHLGQAQEMADKGYEAAKGRHTWRSRAEQIAECFL